MQSRQFPVLSQEFGVKLKKMVVQVHQIRMCNYQSTKYNFAQDLDIIPNWVWPTGTKTTVFVQSAGRDRHEVADIRTTPPPPSSDSLNNGNMSTISQSSPAFTPPWTSQLNLPHSTSNHRSQQNQENYISKAFPLVQLRSSDLNRRDSFCILRPRLVACLAFDYNLANK